MAKRSHGACRRGHIYRLARIKGHFDSQLTTAPRSTSWAKGNGWHSLNRCYQSIPELQLFVFAMNLERTQSIY